MEGIDASVRQDSETALVPHTARTPRFEKPTSATRYRKDARSRTGRMLATLFACTSLSTTLLLSPNAAIAQAADTNAAAGNDDVINLDQVVVTAAGFEQTVRDAPASIS